MTKPSTAAIRASGPLSIDPLSADRMSCCNVCGKPAAMLEVWRAHDERDRPIPGDVALVFLGAGDEHRACHAKLEAHPRMFGEEDGQPGHLPRLCGPCVFRSGLACANPSAKKNGGPGLRLELANAGGILCGRGGCRPIPQPALGCSGRALRRKTETEEGDRDGKRVA